MGAALLAKLKPLSQILNQKFRQSFKVEIHLFIYFFESSILLVKNQIKIFQISPTVWLCATATPNYLSLRSKV